MRMWSVISSIAGKQEGWSRFGSFYWTFVTPTRVGYGDLRPRKRRARIIAILTALLGLVSMGIIIASNGSRTPIESS
jgi:voltage-gated potassium channel